MRFESIGCVEAINRLISNRCYSILTEHQLEVLVQIFGQIEVDESIKYVERFLNRKIV